MMTESGEQNKQVLSPVDIGSALKAAREEQGISLAEIAERTCIAPSHLKAIEAGQFDQLPGIGYVPGFLRNYCNVIGIDAEPVVSAFKTSKNNSLARPEYRFPVQALVPKMASSMVALIIVCLALGGYVFWIFASDRAAEQVASLETVPQSDVPELISEDPALATLGTVTEPAVTEIVQSQSERADISEDSQLIQPEAPSQTSVTQVADAAVDNDDVQSVIKADDNQLVAEVNTSLQNNAVSERSDVSTLASDQDVRVAQTTNDIQSSRNEQPLKTEPVDEQTSRGGVSALATPRAPERELIITANSPSWVEIAKRDGEVLVSKLLRSGEKLVTAMDDELLLSTGNAGGLTLKSSDMDAFQMGKVGEILRDMPLSREGVRTRFNLTSY